MNLWDLHLPAPGIYPLSLPIADLRGPFTGIEFSNNCRWLLVCHGHTAITVWDLDLDSIRATSSERVGRNLSEAEWKTIFPTEEYRKTFRILPCDSKAYNKARQLARDGKIEEAVTTFREIIRNDPGVRLDPVAEARALAAPRHVEQAEETILKLAHDASEPFSVAQQAVEARYLAGLEEFKRASNGTVLVASSMDRGVDLPGDLCRVVVVMKIPFLNLGDKQISTRLYSGKKSGQLWYTVSAIRTLIQMCGRGIRSAEDQCDIYILDAQFERLYRDKYLFPQW